MGGHHLILGKLQDIITGETIDDTHDERYRQEIARRLIETLGYEKGDIRGRIPLEVRAQQKRARIRIDWVVLLKERMVMVIKYGPGSIVTRHRPALAASRLLAPYQIPIVVVTNGRDADVLDGATGKVTGSGLDAIPAKKELLRRWSEFSFSSVTSDRAEKESCLLYAYEVDDACPCDEDICRLQS
uniref:Type I restriction enzyme R protein N-terminal domain-containing protein n=1 Tax=Desulfatirhabdium butyrativorans TaxID=340467 RepID=A0A7C4W032_9BACT